MTGQVKSRLLRLIRNAVGAAHALDSALDRPEPLWGVVGHESEELYRMASAIEDALADHQNEQDEALFKCR